MRIICRGLAKGLVCNAQKTLAFSLTELLMALLVISILLIALTPVMTKRANDSLTIKGRNNYAVLTYGDANCPSVPSNTLDNGNASCNGNFLVPDNAVELTITLIAAGGGGGSANTSGYTEYTQEGSTNSFTVPYGTTELEATLISGGAGGGAGGAWLVLIIHT